MKNKYLTAQYSIVLYLT